MENKTGILLVNLGSPNFPTEDSIRSYLKDFLSDPMVVTLPRVLWLPILYCIILPRRPKKLKYLYQKIWTDNGSPLLVHSLKQKETLTKILDQSKFVVEIGMRYGLPSFTDSLLQLRRRGCNNFVIIPLFGQYSIATTGSICNQLEVFREKNTWFNPRIIKSFCDNHLYIKALVDRVQEERKKFGKGEKLLISFHGMPEKVVKNGDPYYKECQRTTSLLVEQLQLKESEYMMVFQSRFGRAEWIRPYADEVIIQLAKDGVKKLDIVCPGFSVDCLETLEEVDNQYRELFLKHGGKEFNYIKALNDHPVFLQMLAALARDCNN